RVRTGRLGRLRRRRYFGCHAAHLGESMPGLSAVPVSWLVSQRALSRPRRRSGLRKVASKGLDISNTRSHTGEVDRADGPWLPPTVDIGDGIVAHLLCWELLERDGSWHAWVQSTGEPG